MSDEMISREAAISALTSIIHDPSGRLVAALKSLPAAKGKINSGRIGLKEFAQIIDTPIPTLRSVRVRHKSLYPPINDGKKQREFDGCDVVIWLTFRALCDAGLSQKESEEALRLSGFTETVRTVLQRHEAPKARYLCVTKAQFAQGGAVKTSIQATISDRTETLGIQPGNPKSPDASIVTSRHVLSIHEVYRSAAAKAAGLGYPLLATPCGN